MAAITQNRLMGQISASTLITFARGAVRGTSRVTALVQCPKTAIIFVEETPFHPVNMRWADQPADQGTLTFPSLEQKTFTVAHCQIWAIHKITQEVREDREVPRQEKGSWWQVVGHEMELPEIPCEKLLGASVNMEVDATYRDALSLHHSASHLAACALNCVAKRYWKEASTRTVRVDSLGFPDTDQLAIEKSSIFPDHSEEIYRFGKSVKKSGLEVDRLLQDRDVVAQEVNDLLQQWIATRAEALIEAEGSAIGDTRKWVCSLPIGKAVIPCGGTHAPQLGAFARIQYTLTVPDGTEEIRLKAIIKAERGS